jgi:hypothetical protein
MFGALAWKQFREFALLFAILAIFLVGWCLFISIIATNKNFFTALIFAVPFTTVCGLALALPLIAFTSEKESGTINMLAQLPVSPYTVGLSKFFACVVTLAAFLVIEVAALFIAHKIFGEPFVLMGTTFFSISLSFLTLAAALTCTLRCKNSMTAVAATTGLIVVTYAMATGLTAYWSELQANITIEVLDVSIVGFGLAMFVFALASVGNWLRPRSRSQTLERATANTASSRHSMTRPLGSSHSLTASKNGSAKPGVILQMLLWQSVRQQRTSLLLGALIAMVITIASFFIFHIASLRGIQLAHSGVLAAPIGLGFSIVGFSLGMGAIFHDKTNSRFKFFQQHREHGRLFWLSRILPPASLLGLISLTFGLFVSGLGYSATALVLFVGLGAFGSTLLWGLICKSNVFVSILGLGTSLAMGVIGTLLAQMDPGAMLIGFLLPVVIMGITWLYAPTWMAGTKNYAWHFLIGLTLAATFICATTMVMNHRLNGARESVANWANYESTKRAQQKSPELDRIVAPTIDAKQQTRLTHLLNANPTDGEALAEMLIENREAIAIQHSSVYFADTSSPSDEALWQNKIKIQNVLRRQREETSDSIREFHLTLALQLISRANGHDTEFSNLLAWITSDDRTVDDLQTAIEELQRFRPGSFLKGFEEQYLQAVTPDDVAYDLGFSTVGSSLMQIRWERQRLTILFQSESRTMDENLLVLEQLQQVTSTFDHDVARRYQEWKTETFFPELRGSNGFYYLYTWPSFVNQDRYLMVRAALEIYRKREGVYPKTLQQLAPDTIPKLPVYVSGGDFGYVVPKNIDRKVIVRNGVDFQIVNKPILFQAPLTREATNVDLEIKEYESGQNYLKSGRTFGSKFEFIRNFKKATLPLSDDEKILLCRLDFDGNYMGQQVVYGDGPLEDSPWTLKGTEVQEKAAAEKESQRDKKKVNEEKQKDE